MGTKAEWAKVSIAEKPKKAIVVKCTDGGGVGVMALRMTESEFAEFLNRKKQRDAAAPDAPVKAPQRESKYGNRKTERDGLRFDSKHEAGWYETLRLRGLAGEFYGLARQVTFFLPGGVKYIADFVTLNTDGTYTVLDAKSEATRKDKVYRLKRRQMEQCLGIEIKEV